MDDDRGIFIDLYELTMGAVYHARGLDTPATFELFVRGMPAHRNFLVAAGLEAFLEHVESFQILPHQVDYLRSLEVFGHDYLEHLAALRFTGDVWAMPEGSVFFPDEPVLRVTAPRIQAQLLETFALTAINFQSMVASKAARIAIAAEGRSFVDFSARRDHGLDAALYAARSAYIAGAAGTSNLVAAMRFGIPASGTMAHSYVMSYGDEVEAFVDYMLAFPDGTTLLIDTYDIEQGAHSAIEAQRRVHDTGARVGAVRIDSGHFADESRKVRALLNDAGMEHVRIFVSGDLDEHSIYDLVAAGAPVDAFGVGTRLGVSSDHPYLPGVYKLVEDERGARFKTSPGKETLPGAKQAWRHSRDGRFVRDIISLASERVEDASPLLVQQMAEGNRLHSTETLDTIRARVAGQVAALPERLRSLDKAEPYPVELSPGMVGLRNDTVRR